MSDIKALVENLAKRKPDHDDVTKCASCWKEKIRSEVANEYLKAGKLSAEHLKDMFAEVNKRWKTTELYMRVQSLLAEGKTIEEVQTLLQAEGIEI